MGFSKWFRGHGKKTNGVDIVTLSDIIRGMQFCVNSGIEIAEQHYSTTLSKYFDENGQPVTKTIVLDQEHIINIPLVCMTHHNYMAMDELTVKMGIVLKDVASKKAVTEYKGHPCAFEVTRASFDVDLANPSSDKNGNTYMDVEMKFKSAVPPEAVSRMIDKLNSTIAIFVDENMKK